MPFKSDKQRKWMYANDPEMAKKWEKEETLREKLRGVIKQEMKSMQAYSKSTQKAIDIDDEDDEKHESVNEVRLVGYDKSYLDNAKKRLKVPHEITDIEYNQTRYRGPHDKFVKIFYKLKWKPGTRLDTEEKYVSVFYDSPERLKMIGKTLKLKLKESVKEATSSKDFFSGSKVTNSLPRATLSLLNSKLNKASDVIIKITDKYKKQGDIDGLVKIWMMGLHLRLKKSGIKMESVNEVQKRQATDVAVKFDKAYLNFSREIRDIIKMVVRITGNRTDGKIFDKSYTKHLIPFDALFKSWYRGQQNNPHIKESVNEAFGDLNDDGFKKVEKYNKIAIKLVKKLENAVRHSEGKDAVKWIKGLYDAAGIMYDIIGHKIYYESDLGLTYKRGKTVKVKHKTSGKSLVIIDKPTVRKEYEKIGFYVESVNEKVAKPFSEHLRKAQDEIEYMISNGPTPDGDDGVYDRPNQAMKLLQIAQKSLGKIK
jgi:hypothetical protein